MQGDEKLGETSRVFFCWSGFLFFLSLVRSKDSRLLLSAFFAQVYLDLSFRIFVFIDYMERIKLVCPRFSIGVSALRSRSCGRRETQTPPRFLQLESTLGSSISRFSTTRYRYANDAELAPVPRAHLRSTHTPILSLFLRCNNIILFALIFISSFFSFGLDRPFGA